MSKRHSNTLKQRIKQRFTLMKINDAQISWWIVIASIVATMYLAILTAIGLPTAPNWWNHLFTIGLAIMLNSILFVIVTSLLAFLLSFIRIPIPYIAISSLVYTGILYGVDLHYAKAGLYFSITIGVLAGILCVLVGCLLALLSHSPLASKLVTFTILFALLISSWQGDLYWEKQQAASILDKTSIYGNYDVQFFSYGSGSDKYRKEYAENVSEITPSVDASHFITKWKEKRTEFWGFNPQAFPLNGRVFMPDGQGPFPVVLMVHGNHTMEYFSTAGYDYLGEVLASQGIVFISVDEDYVNYSNFTGQPNDNYLLRTWLLLQHAIQLKDMNENPDSIFYGKLDMHAVGLSGHSRGGQAAAMAADYERFFDDPALLAALEDIKFQAVAAISPTDKVIDKESPHLEDIAYFSIHGAQDADVYNFRGDDQYYRTHMTGDEAAFKATAYVEKANHVQFNTDWGKYDLSLPKGLPLNQGTLISSEAQQQIAQVYLSTFFQAAFHETIDYDTLLQDKKAKDHMLPDVRILEKYVSHDYEPLVQYNDQGEILGDFYNFSNYEVVRPSNRSGGKHAKHALQLAWEEEAVYSISLHHFSHDDIHNMVFSLANQSLEEEIEMFVTIDNGNGHKISEHLTIPPAIQIQQTPFALFDRIYRDGKYKVDHENIFINERIALDEWETSILSDTEISFHFISPDGQLLIEEIGLDK